MEQTPSFTFKKESSARHVFFGEVNPTLAFSIVLLIVVGIVWGGAYILSRILDSNIQEVKDKISAARPQWKKQLENDILSLPARVTRVKEVVGEHTYASAGFDFIREHTLKTVSISSMDVSVKDSGLDVKGEAVDVEALARQIVWLRSQKTVINLELGEVSLEGGKIKFSLDLDLSPQVFKQSKS